MNVKKNRKYRYDSVNIEFMTTRHWKFNEKILSTIDTQMEIQFMYNSNLVELRNYKLSLVFFSFVVLGVQFQLLSVNRSFFKSR